MECLAFCFNGIHLVFGIDDKERLLLLHCSCMPYLGADAYYKDFQTAEFRAVEVQISGGHINYGHGTKNLGTSEGANARYRSHRVEKHCDGQELVFTVFTSVEIELHYRFYDGLPVMRTYTVVKNTSERDVNLEYVSSFLLYGIGKSANGNRNAYENLRLLTSYNSSYRENQWRLHTLDELGFVPSATYSTTCHKAGTFNTGSWSTKQHLPKGILVNAETGENIYWHIESNGSWSCEIGDYQACLYLALSGPNQTENQWIHTLKPGETFTSVAAVTAYGSGDYTDMFAYITAYTRHVRRPHIDYERLPIIFNPYMHNAGEYPTEEQTLFDINGTADLDIDYFCIDAGWHDEEDYWKAIGNWQESKCRFPGGLQTVFDKMRARGVQPGLWLELEMMGYFNPDKTSLSPDCYFMRGGGIVANNGRINLDFRNAKVIDRMDRILDGIVEKYRIGYIKIDYNADCGAGTEVDAASLGDGLLMHNRAYLAWLERFMDRYPRIIVEGCASGGLRLDPLMQRVHSIFSTSDQTDYALYPYIASNMLSNGTPEQMAVWCYPKTDGTEETVIMNVVNTLLGRLHLSGQTARITGAQRELLKEGLAVHRALAEFKKRAVPFFPCGLNRFHSGSACAGLRLGDRGYLAVWNLKKEPCSVRIPLDKLGKNVTATPVYPENFGDVEYAVKENVLTVNFSGEQARFFGLNI